MDFFSLFSDLLSDYTLRTVAIGSGILGIVSGSLGAYAVLRKQSLLGDAMSHAALPGIAVAFLLTRSKAPVVLIIGAAIAGWIGTLLIIWIVRSTRIKNDTAMGMVLSVFFGVGLVLLTYIQSLPDASQAGLDKFLFGQAAALLQGDLIMIGGIAALALILLNIFWKELKLVSFDPEYGAVLGLPMRALEILLTTLLVIAIVLGLQTVGVVLMSAMIVAPAAAARQWTDKMGMMITLAALFGFIAGVSGAVLSSATAKLPTGPTIVLCMSAIVVISILFSPNRGLIWAVVRRHRNRGKLRTDAVLCDLFSLAVQHGNREHSHPASVLDAMRATTYGVEKTLEVLESRGLVFKSGEHWALTASGYDEAENVARSIGEPD